MLGNGGAMTGGTQGFIAEGGGGSASVGGVATGGATTLGEVGGIGASGGTAIAGVAGTVSAGNTATGGGSLVTGSTNSTTGGTPSGGVGAGAGGVSTTGGLNAGGTNNTAGAAHTDSIGGASANGGRSAKGGTFATGGVSTKGGSATSGGAQSTGGIRGAGGSATTGGRAATGGDPTSGGTSSTGGSLTTGGVATGGLPATGGNVATGGTAGNVCPNPLTKPAALLAAEPTPLDPCAHVSSVILESAGYYAYGFTNGEAYLVSVNQPTSSLRVDDWNQSGTYHYLPRALITTLFAQRNNFYGSLQVGYADATQTLQNPWYAAQNAGATGWMPWTSGTAAGAALTPGTVLALSACPFHSAPTHLLLATPWTTQETQNSSYTVTPNYSAIDQHLQITGGGGASTVETVTVSGGWQVFVGTSLGQLFRTNVLTETVTWNDATQTLDGVPVTWTRITDASMPSAWVTRVTVHPTNPLRLFAVFASRDDQAIWYSGDGGGTWTNRTQGLPTTSNPAILPPLIGASFNPFLDGAAYIVTPQTSYYTTDYGMSGWLEW